MKKIIAILIITSYLFTLPVPVYAGAESAIIGWGIPTYWTSSGKVIPMLTRAGKWFKPGLGWASIALILGGIALDVYKNGIGIEPIDSFLASAGLRWKDGTWQKGTQGYTDYAGNAGAQYVADVLRQNCSGSGSCGMSPPGEKNDIGNYPGEATLDAALKAAQVCPAGWRCPTTTAVGGNYTYDGYTATLKYIRTDNYSTYRWWFGVYVKQGATPIIPNQGTIWTNITTGEAIAEIRSHLTTLAGTGAQAIKDLWDYFEPLIAGAYPVNGQLLDMVTQSGKTIREVIQEDVEPQIDETFPDPPSPPQEPVAEGWLDQILAWLKNLYDTIKEILEAIVKLPETVTTALSGDIEGQELPEPPSPSNDDFPGIVEDFGLEDKEETQKSILKGLLETITGEFDDFRDAVQTAMDNMIETSGSCQAFSTEVYGKNMTFDFCEMDWSKLKAGIQIVSGMYALFLLIGVL